MLGINNWPEQEANQPIIQYRSATSMTVNDMQGMVGKIKQLESTLRDKEVELEELKESYHLQKQEIKGTDLESLDLSMAEKQALKKIFTEEESISFKTLLNKILKKEAEISLLRSHISECESILPTPHVVIEGEDHFQIALNYLVFTHGLSEEESTKHIERCGLVGQLAPGFKVWNFWTGRLFGSFVTQGSASVSPNHLRRMEKKEIRETAMERNMLAAGAINLEKKKERCLMQIDHLTNQRDHLVNKIKELREVNTRLNRVANSLHYKIDLSKNLINEGTLKRRFLKKPELNNMPSQKFPLSIDLSSKDEITILASHLSLKEIKKLKVYPELFREGEDYIQTIDPYKNEASVTILRPDKFKSRRIILAIN